MENTTLKMAMLGDYHKLAFTDKYILGFSYMGNIYIAYRTAETLTPMVKLDRASRGQGMSIRFKPSKSDKIYLLTGATVLCSEKYFEEEYANNSYNRGEILEKIVTEKVAGKIWEKDSVPFTKAGDVEINGIPFQIKFENATFTNEKTLANMLARA